MDRTDLVSAPIRRKLARLRLSLRLHLAGEGLAWVVLALAALVVVTLAVDWGTHWITHQHMTVVQRLVILVLALAGVAAVAWQHLVRPQRVPMSEADLAQIVERHYPALADRLAGALEFSRVTDLDAIGASEAMVRQMAAEAEAMAKPLAFTAPIRRDRLRRRAAWALAVVIALGALTVWQPVTMRTWLQRDLLLGFWGDPGWPQDTHLHVRGAPTFRVMRGGTLELVIDAVGSQTVPREVVLHMDFPSVGTVEETIALTSSETTIYTRTFDAVAEPFRFHVTGGDDRTEVCEVQLVEPPELREVAFTIEYPAYTGRGKVEVAGDQGVLSVPVGSWVTLRGRASKDLSAAALFVENEPAGRCEITSTPSSEGGPAAPREVVGRFKVTTAKRSQPSLALRVALTDAEKFTNPHGVRYTLVLLKDREPAVQMAIRGVGGQITQKARIPLTLSAKDDYGVGRMDLEFAIAGVSDEAVRMPVHEWSTIEAAVRTDYVLDLDKLSEGMAEGESLVKVGETIRLAAAARDGLPPPDGPNTGRSSPALLKVVSDADLLAGLIQMQKAMREQFRQAMVLQSEAQGRTDAARQAAEAGQTPAEVERQASESARLQKQVSASLGTIADRFAQILEQLDNNRVGTDADKQRLKEKILDPMRSLAGESMQRVVADLDAAMKAENKTAELTRIAGVQEGFSRQMESILAEMVQLESAEELERWLKSILDLSSRVKAMTEAERKAREQQLRERLEKVRPN